MSKKSVDLAASQKKITVEPDLFGLYASEVADLLSQDEGLWALSHQSSHLTGNFHELAIENGKSKFTCVCGSTSLYSNGIGALLSEFKNERLKSLLRQSVFTLTPEVDEMIKPILSLCRIQSCLKYKDSLVSIDPSSSKTDQSQRPPKKRKIARSYLDLHGEHKHLTVSGKESSGDPRCANGTPGWKSAPDGTKIDDDLRCILENDSSRVAELMKEHSSEFLAKLLDMEQKLEKILNLVMTTCRPMTRPEKQKLRRLIQNLAPETLNRVVEIIGQKNPSEKYCSDEVNVDLDEQDNVTLWRLYFYVTTINC